MKQKKSCYTDSRILSILKQDEIDAGKDGFPERTLLYQLVTLMQDPERALDTLAREKLGLNPGEVGSPWLAVLLG